jgi:hypothetical protein
MGVSNGMELLILDTSFEIIGVLDSFNSLIWTDRYSKCGDFELYIEATSRYFNVLKANYYLYLKESEHMMIISDIQQDSDAEEGNYLTVTGNSLEYIPHRRIIWNQTTIDGKLQTGIETLLNQNIIFPDNYLAGLSSTDKTLAKKRKISDFTFSETTDKTITDLTLSAQYTGDNLYDVIVSACEDNEIGFKVLLNDSNQFVFSLYSGTDRSYSQDTNPYIVFSPDFDNIINGDYREETLDYKNVTLVAGEDESENRKTYVAGDTKSSGLDRRELYTDARDIQSEDDDGNTLSDDEYNALLEQRGKENLKDYKITKVFEGEVDTTSMFKYGTDFFLGDIVQLVDDYGNERRARVTEFIRSQNKSGYSAYPGFEIIDEDSEGDATDS